MSLNVVQVLPALEVGGVERGTLEVAAELVRRGHRSIVISAGGRLVEKLVSEGSEHIDWHIGKKSLSTFFLVSKLKQFLQRENIHVLHARSRLPAWIAYLAWRNMDPGNRPKFVTTVHGPYTVNPYSAVMTKGEQVIAISDFIKEYILENYPHTTPDKITVIPRGIDSREFPYGFSADATWMAEWQRQHPGLNNRYIITSPARVTRWKGQEDFITIVHGLKAKGVPVHGLIAGGAHSRRQGYLQELKQRVNNLGLKDDISFLGHRDDLREIMSISHVVFSLAKEPEAFGRTALEALGLGIPVIAYAHGGAAEVMQAIFPQGQVSPHDIQSAIHLAEDFYTSHPHVPDVNPFTRARMLDAILSVYEQSGL